MIKSKEELLACTHAWVEQAKSDIINQINTFMQMTRMTTAQVADALDITEVELRNIMRGECEIGLTTFAKMLIASNNVLEIKPLPHSMLDGRMHGQRPPMPPHGQRPMPPMGGFPMGGYPMPPHGSRPPMGGYPMPPHGNHPTATPEGGMVPSPTNDLRHVPFGGMPGVHPIPVAPNAANAQTADLSSHTRPELVGIIRDHGWDNEIDLSIATLSEIMNFIDHKRSEGVPQSVNEGTAATNTNIPRNRFNEIGVDGNVLEPVGEDTSAEAFRQMLDDAIADNPNLRNVINQYIN